MERSSEPATNSWREYRRRRSLFVSGFVVALVGGTALTLFDVAEPVRIAFWFAVVFHFVFVGTWLVSFLCPACEEEWFGDPIVEADGSHGSVGQTQRPSLLRLATQKLCCHCGLRKFEDPTGRRLPDTGGSKDP
jgi:hypothetical protein